MSACVVIPGFNVARTIGSLVLQLKASGFEVVVVDDGSTDRTGEIACAAGAHVVRHPENIGKGRALRDGFAAALAMEGGPLVTMDGDGQHLPADLPRLLAALEQDGVGVVVGNRMQNLRNMPWVRRATNWMMSRGISRLCGQWVPDSQCGFRAIRREVLTRIALTTDRYEIESELLVKAARAGFHLVSVPVTTVYRNERSRIHPIADTLRFFRFIGTLSLVLLLVAGAVAALPARAEPPDFVEARVADASDRRYEETAIWLMDRAQRSIVVSMYVVTATGDARHPVDRLVRDLEEAARRGVSVIVYPNLKISGYTPDQLMAVPWVRRLGAAGARVVPLAPVHRLHDKLLIVDERFVLEGSTNWSVEALKNNWESNTLSDSPALAAIKLGRLRDREQHDQLTAEPGEGQVLVPTAWLAVGGVLQRLAAAGDERAFDALLLLLRECAIHGEPSFFISLELFGEDLGLPASWRGAKARRQLIKVLRKLQTRYEILTPDFTHSRDARITVEIPPGPSLAIPAAWTGSPALIAQSSAMTYLRLLEQHWAAAEVVLADLSLRELARRTGLKLDRLRAARRVLHPPAP